MLLLPTRKKKKPERERKRERICFVRKAIHFQTGRPASIRITLFFMFPDHHEELITKLIPLFKGRRT